jgi:chromosome segregation ATPase
MVISIDKAKELTRKEYIDFIRNTKGEPITEGRVSQLVSAGKLKVRDYPELNNLQLIVLNDDEQALAQVRFTTSQAIHTYSYKDLGLMVGKLIHDLTIENGNAQTLLIEKQTQFDQLISQLGQVETERNEATQTNEMLRTEQQQLQNQNQSLEDALVERNQLIEQQEVELKRLTEALAESQQKLAVETSFRTEFGAFKSLVMTMLQNQEQPSADVASPSGQRPKTQKRAKKKGT